MPPANTSVRWVNENAFASIVQARPCPTSGRPVHLRGVPPSITARYCSSCPSDSTSRWTPCPPETRRLVASGPPWLVSGFRFRARLGFSIPSTFSGPRGITPAFGYSTPHSSARGTSTLLSKRAAQRTICPLLTSAPRSGHLSTTSVAEATRSRSPGVSSAAFCAQSPDLRFAPLMDMDFAVSRPLVRR